MAKHQAHPVVATVAGWISDQPAQFLQEIGGIVGFLKTLKISFSVRLTAALLLAGLIPLAVLSYADIKKITALSRSSTEQSLKASTALKVQSLETYFDAVINGMQTLAATPLALNALQGFDMAADRLLATPSVSIDAAAMRERYIGQKDLTDGATDQDVKRWIDDLDEVGRMLQQMYIFGNPNAVGEKQQLTDAGDGSRYSALHRKFHPNFLQALERYGLYDIFLIEPDNARIVYSVFKETDFGTSLKSGAYRESAFAKAALEMVENNGSQGTVLVDFEAYAPSYDAFALFLLVPIRDQSEFAGILAVQLPADFADKVLHMTTGLMASEDAYAVGTDGILKSIPLLNSSMKIGTHLQGDVAASVQSDTGELVAGKNFEGKDVFAFSIPLNIQGLDWHIISEVTQDEALAVASTAAKDAKRISLLIAAVIFVSGLVLARLLLAPIRHLGATVETEAKNVVASLAASSTKATEAAEAMASTAEETSRQSSLAHEGAKQTENAVSTVASATEQLSASIVEVITGIKRTAQLADGAAMQSNDASALLIELEAAAERISGMTKMIGDIADRTNLLALNAAVEAAHAGNAGRGFAVVAGEIRKLASSAAEATVQISTEVQTIVSSVERNSQAMKMISEAIEGVNNQAKTISATAQQQGEVTSNIALKMSDAADLVRKVNNSIADLQQASTFAAKSSVDVMDMMYSVDDSSEKITQAMAGFVHRVRTL